jgi:hypothetical protein
MELQKTNSKDAFYLNFDAKSGDIIGEVNDAVLQNQLTQGKDASIPAIRVSLVAFHY